MYYMCILETLKFLFKSTYETSILPTQMLKPPLRLCYFFYAIYISCGSIEIILGEFDFRNPFNFLGVVSLSLTLQKGN